MSLSLLLLISALILLLAYRFYGKYVYNKFGLTDARKAPSHTHRDGIDYEPSKPIVALCAKLLGLAAKVAPTPNDKAQLRNTAAHVARLAIQHGGAYVDLSHRLQKTLSESAALKR